MFMCVPCAFQEGGTFHPHPLPPLPARERGGGKPVEADKTYKVAGWAPVSEEARKAGGEPIWALVERWLVAQKTIRARPLALPEIAGVRGNPGIA